MEQLNLTTEILASIIALYEILSRVIPTSRRWSIVGNILNILHKISDALDKKTKWEDE